ncbi:hypothetical protein LOTGIDRAFT_204975 [Lottia gigantea]|uniref:Spermatogenesis-associated protein 48 n=1 Tax=Lottia gigantea TaxID=225164 RepID=V4CPF5_LOTGI|nr:hypothetical protein LOTGIDRAFT_204975 [Lottia gigantea]ESP04315.1 hypothetical protein LOTGIDRAFT_204975 [Lottia gigantea]
MTTLVNSNYVLSDSNYRIRPDMKTYLMTDNNAGGHSVKQIEQSRRIRQLKFPSLRGKHDYSSMQDRDAAGFRKYNDNGDHRVPAPHRGYDNIIDPTTGFVSAGGDLDRETGHKKIETLVQLNDKPQSSEPKTKTPLSPGSVPAPGLHRSVTYHPGAPSKWNSRKISDSWIRAQLGGWTSDQNPLKNPSAEKVAQSMFVEKQPTELSKGPRDELARKFMYSSSTQRFYEDVDWDNMLNDKPWPHKTTLELRPDMVSHRFSTKKYEPKAQEWQAVGKSWDRFQKRSGYYENRPVTFCCPSSRTKQIPSYGGSIGAVNLEEIDNANIPFDPLTVKRVPIPRPTDTSHTPNIPGYEGCTLYRGRYEPANSTPINSTMNQASTALVHRTIQSIPSSAINKRESAMSKMVTLVPPCNPFKSSMKEGVVTVA